MNSITEVDESNLLNENLNSLLSYLLAATEKSALSSQSSSSSSIIVNPAGGSHSILEWKVESGFLPENQFGTDRTIVPPYLGQLGVGLIVNVMNPFSEPT